MRFIPGDLNGWSAATDELLGPEQYGDPNQSLTAWGKSFDVALVDKFKFESGDGTYYKYYTK